MPAFWIPALGLEYIPEFENGRARCLLCGSYMAKVITGRYRCRRCGRELRTDIPQKDISLLGQRRLADRVYATVCTMKALSMATLRRRFPGERIDEALQDLAREGRIEIQQNGFVADSMHHHKLIVLRGISVRKQPIQPRIVHPAGEPV